MVRNSYFLSSLKSLLNLGASHLIKTFNITLIFTSSVESNNFQYFSKKQKENDFLLLQ